MTRPSFLIVVLALLTASIYLFVQAPAPLPEATAASGKLIPIKTVFMLIAAENNTVRALWTREIVSKGQDIGLAFGEDWREAGVEKGPLPALFLRESATSLEKNPIELSLFLGSDYPINPSNLFSGKQTETFALIQQDGQPQFFFAEDTQLYTAMFADPASVQGCVDCHNNHPDSPKTDWKLNDIMGATTWSYPREAVTLDEFITIIQALRQGFRDAYTAYLDKVSTFSTPPEIGEKWPSDGYYLPSADVFLKEFSQRASANSMKLLIDALQTDDSNHAVMPVGVLTVQFQQ